MFINGTYIPLDDSSSGGGAWTWVDTTILIAIVAGIILAITLLVLWMTVGDDAKEDGRVDNWRHDTQPNWLRWYYLLYREAGVKETQRKQDRDEQRAQQKGYHR